MNTSNIGEGIFNGISRVFDLIKLNLLCLIMCLPIVTIGASLTATYYYLLKMVRNEESYMWKSYWKTFRAEFRQSTTIWLILLAGIMIIRVDFTILADAGSDVMPVRMVLLFLLFVIILVSMYVFPLLARFQNTTTNMLRNAMLMAFRYLPYTALILLFFGAASLLCIIEWRLFPYFILYMGLIGISGPAFLSSILFRKIFDNHIGTTENDSEV